jgi:hypothetical protein
MGRHANPKTGKRSTANYRPPPRLETLEARETPANIQFSFNAGSLTLSTINPSIGASNLTLDVLAGSSSHELILQSSEDLFDGGNGNQGKSVTLSFNKGVGFTDTPTQFAAALKSISLGTEAAVSETISFSNLSNSNFGGTSLSLAVNETGAGGNDQVTLSGYQAGTGSVDISSRTIVINGGLFAASIALASARTGGITLSASQQVTSAGKVTVDNDGTLTIAAGTTVSTGAVSGVGFTQSGGGSVELGGSIITANGSVSFNGAVSLPAAAGTSIVKTVASNGSGGVIDFTSTVSGDATARRSLQVVSGSKSITYGASVTNLGVLRLQEDSAGITGKVEFVGEVNASGLETFARAYEVAFNSSASFSDPIVMASTGALTLGDASGVDSFTFAGGFTNTAGATNLDGDTLQTANAQFVAGNLRVKKEASIATGSGAIQVSSLFADGVKATLTSGSGGISLGTIDSGTTVIDTTGSLTVTGLVGNTTLPDLVHIKQAGGGAAFQGVFKSVEARIAATNTGTVTFQKATTVSTLSALGGTYSLRFEADTTVDSSPVVFANSGVLALGNDASDKLSFTNSLTAKSASSLSLAGLISAGDAIDLGAATLAAAVSLESGSSLAIGAVSTGGNPLRLEAAGNLTVGTVADLRGGLTISDAASASIGALGGSNPGSITLTDSQGAISFTASVNATTLSLVSNQSGGVSFADDVAADSLTAGAAAGDISFLGNVVVSGQASLLTTGAITLGNADADTFAFTGGLTRSGGSTAIRGSVSTSGNAGISLADAAFSGVSSLTTASGQVSLSGTATLAAGTSLSLASTSGGITVAGDVDGVAVGAGGLSLSTGGTISFTGSIGATKAIGALAINGSAGSQFSDLNVGTLSLAATAAGAGQLLNFAGDVTVTSGWTMGSGTHNYDLAMTGASVSVAGATVIAAKGNLTLGDADDDSLVFSGGLTVTAASGISLRGSVSTLGSSALTLGDADTAVSVSGNSTIGGSATGAVSLGGLLLASASGLSLESAASISARSIEGVASATGTSLTVTAGGSFSATGNIDRVGTLEINKAAGATFAGSIGAAGHGGLTLGGSVTGTVQFDGASNRFTTADFLGGSYGVTWTQSAVFDSSINLLNTGVTTLGVTTSVTGEFTASGGPLQLAGDLTATGAVTTLKALTVAANALVRSTSSSISVEGTTNALVGNEMLTLSAANAVAIKGLVGNSKAPGQLNFGATGSVQIDAIVKAGAVSISQASAGAVESTAAIFAPGGVALAGSTVKVAAIDTSAIGNADGGDINLSGATITLTGNLTAKGAASGVGVNHKGGSITLTGNTVLDGSSFSIRNDPVTGGIVGYANNSVTIQGKLDGQSASGQSLLLEGQGTAFRITGAVGSANRLASLESGRGTNPESVSLDSTLKSDAATLSASSVALGGAVDLAGALRFSGSSIALANAATVSADSMSVTLVGAGTITLGTGAINLSGGLSQIGGAGATISLGANITAASVALASAVSLTQGVTINTSAASGAVRLDSAVAGGNRPLTLSLGSGDLTSGASMTDLSSLAITAGSVKLAGGEYSAAGATSLVGGLVLTGSGSIAVRGGAGLTVTGDIDDTASANDSSLTLASASGSVTVNGAVGVAQSLAGLAIMGGVSAVITGDTGTASRAGVTGAFSISAPTVRLNGLLYRAGTTLDVAGQRLSLAESAGAPVEIRAGGALAIGNAVSTTSARDLAIYGSTIGINAVDNLDGFHLQNLSLTGTGVGSVALGGSIAITGDFTVASATGIVALSSLAIDTCQGGAFAGAVNLGSMPVSASATGVDLVIDSSATNAGDISIGTIGSAGGQALRSFRVTSLGAGSTGLININGSSISVAGGGSSGVSLDGHVVLKANLSIQSPGASVALAALGGSVSTPGTRHSLGINTMPALAGAGGSVILGLFNDNAGGLAGPVAIDTSGSGQAAAGTLTLLNNLALGGLTLAGAGKVLLGGPVRIEALGGDVLLGSATIANATSTITGTVSNSSLTVVTAASKGSGKVAFGSVDGSGGSFLTSLTVDAGIDAPSAQVRLNGDLFVAGDIVLDGHVALGSSRILDSTKGGIPGAVRVAMAAGSLSATAAGSNLEIITKSSTQSGGAVALGPVGNAGGAFLQSLLIETAGGGVVAVPGSLTLSGNIQLDGSVGSARLAYDAGNQSGAKVIIIGPVTIDTASSASAGGAVFLGSADSSANATITAGTPGAELSINTDAAIRGGDVAFGKVDGSGGDWLEALTINTGASATTDGVANINGGWIGTSGGAGISINGTLELVVSTTLDTHDESDAAGGGLVTLTGLVTARMAGLGFVIDASTSSPGQTGGDITLDAMGAGPSYVAGLTARTGGPGGPGRLILRNSVLLDGSAAIGASFVFDPGSKGGPGTVLVRADAVIDTEQGGDGPAGDILLGGVTLAAATAVITSDAVGVDLALVSEGAVSGGIAFGDADNSGNKYLQTLLVDAVSSGAGGLVRVNGAAVATSGTALAGDITLAGARVEFSSPAITISTANGATAVNAGAIDLTGVVATLATGAELALDTSTSASGRSGGNIRLDTIGATGAFPKALSISTSGPVSALAGGLFLGGDIRLDGGNLILGNVAPVAIERTVLIDTAQSAVLGGSVLLGDSSATNATAPLRALATGASLTISTAAAMRAGDIALGAVEAGSAVQPAGVSLDARGLTLGTITLNGDMAVSGGVDIQGSLRIGGSRVITAGASGVAQPVSLANLAGNIGSTGTGYDLTIGTTGASGNGMVTLGPVVEDQGNLLNDLTVATGAGASLVLRGSVSLGASGGDLGDLTLSTGGGTLLIDGRGQPVAITTLGGSVWLGGSTDAANGVIRPAQAGDRLRINTVGTSSAGAVAFGSVDSNSGNYLSQLEVDALFAGVDRLSTPGSITINSGSILTAATGTNPPSVALLGDTHLAVSTLLSTAGAGSAQGGAVRLEGSIAGAVSGIDLSVRTAGGAVRLEAVNSIRDLDINTTGNTTGSITLAGDISLAGSSSNRGDLTVSTLAPVVLLPLDQDSKAIQLTTDGGFVHLGGALASSMASPVSAASSGVTLAINTAPGSGPAGTVVLGAFNSAAGFKVNSLLVDAFSGATNPALVRLLGDISLGQGPLSLDGTVVLGSSRSINTSNGDIRLAAGGGTLSASSAGTDLALVSGGGAVMLGPVGNAGGAFINDLTVDTRGAGASFGDFVAGGSILLDAAGADAASLIYLGDDFRLNAPVVILDTLQSPNGPGGDLFLGSSDTTAQAGLSAMVSGASLLIDTRGNSANGRVAIGSVSNGPGGADRFHLGSLGIVAASSGSPGGIFLNGGTIQTDGVTLFGSDTRQAEVYLEGAITASGSLAIDTQATSGIAGDVVVVGALSVATAGASLTIDASSSTDVVASGTIDLSGAATTVAGTVSLATSGGSTGGQPVTLGQVEFGGATTIQSGSGTVFAPGQANDFKASVSITSSGTVFIRDMNSLVLGNTALGAGTANFLAVSGIGQASGTAIRQSEIVEIIFRAGADGIALAGSNNEFLGPVTLAASSGGSVQIFDSTALNLASVSLDSAFAAALTIGARGEITQEPGSSITTGTGQFSAQTESAAITLSSGGNAFNGPVALRNLGAASISLTASQALLLSRVSMAGDKAGTLTLNANGAITQTQGGTITTGTGAVSLQSAFAGIDLSNTASNSFNGAVAFTAASAVSLTAKGALALQASSAPSAQLATEAGNLTDNGVISLAGNGSFETRGSGSSIILDALSVGGVVTVATTGAGGDATVVNSGPLAFQGTVGGVLTARSVTGAVTDAGPVRFGSRLVIGSNSQDSVLDTVITSSQAGGALVFEGPGKLLISGNGTYGGPTTISSGVVEVTGSLASSQAIVNGGLLRGTGSLAGIVSLDSLAPGLASTGIITSNGNFAMATGSGVSMRLQGGTPGTGHDQIVVNGSVILNNPTLSLAVLPYFNPGSIAQFTLIRNAGSSPVQGQFRNLPEAAALTLGGAAFRISYKGGTQGRDVVLNRVSKVPVITLETPVVAASDSGTTFTVRDSKGLSTTYTAFAPGTPGGTRVAAGIHPGVGQPFVVAATGPGTPAQVRVISLLTGSAISTFTPFPGWTGGLSIATGDVNNDGFSDYVVARDGPSAPLVTVFSGRTLGIIKSFLAFPASFSGGVRVACADVNGDGLADVIAANGAGMRGTMKVFSSSARPALMFRLSSTALVGPASLRSGLNIAAADLNGDRRADLLAAYGNGGPPTVTVIRGGSKLGAVSRFSAADGVFTGGIRVAVASSGIVTGTGAGIPGRVDIYNRIHFSRIDTLFSLVNGLDGVRV